MANPICPNYNNGLYYLPAQTAPLPYQPFVPAYSQTQDSNQEHLVPLPSYQPFVPAYSQIQDSNQEHLVPLPSYQPFVPAYSQTQDSNQEHLVPLPSYQPCVPSYSQTQDSNQEYLSTLANYPLYLPAYSLPLPSFAYHPAPIADYQQPLPAFYPLPSFAYQPAPIADYQHYLPAYPCPQADVTYDQPVLNTDPNQFTSSPLASTRVDLPDALPVPITSARVLRARRQKSRMEEKGYRFRERNGRNFLDKRDYEIKQAQRSEEKSPPNQFLKLSNEFIPVIYDNNVKSFNKEFDELKKNLKSEVEVKKREVIFLNLIDLQSDLINNLTKEILNLTK